MKAIVFDQKSGKLEIRDVPQPDIGRSDLLIRLKAAALNHRDLWFLKGRKLASDGPIILGSDGTGTVEKAGDNVKNIKPGDEVIINPSLKWGDSTRVQGKDYEILGFPSPGTFAEYIAIDEAYVHQRPRGLTWHESAALPLAGLTAFRALFTRGETEPGNRVLITGIGGGVALFALGFAVSSGTETYVTSGDDTKLSRALELGAKAGVNYRKGHWKAELQRITDGFDVIIDSAGGQGFPELCELAGPGGRIAIYGRTAGAIPTLDPRTLFWKQLSIHGTTMGTKDEFREMVRLVNAKGIKPVIDSVYTAWEINQAFEKMDRGEQFGKLVIDLEDF